MLRSPGSPQMRRLLLTSSLMLGLVACTEDPLAAQAAPYAESMQPLLDDNMKLAEQFLGLAAQIKKEKVDGAGVAQTWSTEVVPLATDLATRAATLQAPEGPLTTEHQLLVEAWTNRAVAYQDLDAAYKGTDPAAFQAAFDANLEAKLGEEEYFRRVNGLLGPYGVHLDQYP